MFLRLVIELSESLSTYIIQCSSSIDWVKYLTASSIANA